MTAPLPLPVSSAPGLRPTPGAFRAVYRLILRSQATVGRIALVTALAVVGILIGLAVGANDGFDHTLRGARLVNGYSFTVLTPIVCLVFASSALGDLVDDRTLVYLWLKPTNRLTTAAAAGLASLTVCLPAVVIPTTITAALTKGGPDLVLAAVVGSVTGVVAYVGMFLALGLRFRRALVWGLAYILLWEGFVATASKTANRLAIRGYTQSVLSEYTGVGFKGATLPVVAGIVVPLVVGVLFVLLTGRRLARTPVD